MSLTHILSYICFYFVSDISTCSKIQFVQKLTCIASVEPFCTVALLWLTVLKSYYPNYPNCHSSFLNHLLCLPQKVYGSLPLSIEE